MMRFRMPHGNGLDPHEGGALRFLRSPGSTTQAAWVGRLLLMVSLGFGWCISPPALASRQPNIILMITDDQSPMAWPSKGEGLRCSEGFAFQGFDVLTPHVDALAAGGMVFTDANVATSVCSPSRYSMLTGRYASRCRGSNYLARYPLGTPSRPENLVEMSSRESNVAKVLRRAGYRTGFVGKCHFLRHDLINDKGRRAAAGFQTYKPDDDPRDPAVRAAMEYNHGRWQAIVREVGFDWAEAVYPANLKELRNEQLNVHNVEWTVDAARRFIEESGDTPFFLYFSTTLPHGPAPWHQDPGGALSYSLDADPFMTGAGHVERNYEFMPARRTIKDRVLQAGKNEDTAYITWLDAGIGAIIDKVRELGLEEDTLFVLTSDHGAWRSGKATAYEGGGRVPLIISWKARIPADSDYDGLVQNIDLVPTFLDLAGVGVPSDFVVDGVSLKPVLLEHERDPLRDNLFMEIGYARAIKTKHWKYIAVRYPPEIQRLIDSGTPFNGWQGARLAKPHLVVNSHLGHFSSTHNSNYFDSEQLYDLQADPREERNLAEDLPGRVAAMRAVLTKHLASFPDRPFGEFVTSDDESLNEVEPPAKRRPGPR